MRALCCGIASAVWLFFFPAALHAATPIDPATPLAGQSQAALAEQWWQWVMAIPRATNPVADLTGEFAGINNTGPVFFIAGGATPRSFNVPADKPIFFPLLNTINVSSHYFDAVEAYCPEQPDPMGCALAWASPTMDAVSGLFARLDGEDMLPYSNTRHTSSAFFDVSVPEDDLFGWNDPPVALPAGTFPAAADGHWLAIADLAPGAHLLEFGGTWGWGQTLYTVANINVVPEPGSAAMLLVGLAALAARRRRG